MDIAGRQDVWPPPLNWVLSPGAPKTGVIPRSKLGWTTPAPATKFWPQSELNSPRLLVHTQANSMAGQVQEYTRYLSQLLDASQVDDQPLEETPSLVELLTDETRCGYELVIWGEPRQSRIERLLFGSPVYRLLERVPTSLLVARQPRWPLKQILLIIRSEEAHGLAVNWTACLAQASGATVTVLVIIPLVSPSYTQEARLQQGLAMLFATENVLERQIAYVSQRLEDWGLEASLRLRQGSPDQQIRDELSAESYDLIIAAAESQDWWLRRLIGESVEPVLNRANCPVLIAKPFCGAMPGLQALDGGIKLDKDLIADCRTGEI